MESLRYVNIQPEHAEGLEALMFTCFPQITSDDLLDADEFRHYTTLFPEGTFVVLDGERLVGMGTGLFIDVDFENLPATEHELIGGGYYANHSSDGDYYYGVGICVHPDYRRRGIGGQLYNLRKGLVRRYNKKGFVAAGVLAGYGQYKTRMSAQAYTDKVIAGELYDATLSVQLRNGFRVARVYQGFFIDLETDSWATLIVWDNPEYSV